MSSDLRVEGARFIPRSTFSLTFENWTMNGRAVQRYSRARPWSLVENIMAGKSQPWDNNSIP